MSMSPTIGLLVLSGCKPMQYSAGLRNERFAVLSPNLKYVLHQAALRTQDNTVLSRQVITADGNNQWCISKCGGKMLQYLHDWEWDEAGPGWDSELDQDFLDQFIDLFGE